MTEAKGAAHARREFLRFVAASPFALAACRAAPSDSRLPLTNALAYEEEARTRLSREAFDFLAGGADDEWTLARNRAAFSDVALRARRLIDVSTVDTRVDLFGETLASPIVLAPMGSQRIFHRGGEVAVARAAARRDHRLTASTFSSDSLEDIAAAAGRAPWFQLYPTVDRDVTRSLLRRVEAVGCPVLALTVDTPVVGNRERQRGFLRRLLEEGTETLGNFVGVEPLPGMVDPSLDWEFVRWLRGRTSALVVLKGIVTAEDAELAMAASVDGIWVSNHGGRQEDSGRATIESLPEVVEVVGGRVPVILDGGVRRGTDVLKALSTGATAVAVGRPYGYGLAARGERGVEEVLELLQAELVRTMQLCGVTEFRSGRHRSRVDSSGGG